MNLPIPKPPSENSLSWSVKNYVGLAEYLRCVRSLSGLQIIAKSNGTVGRNGIQWPKENASVDLSAITAGGLDPETIVWRDTAIANGGTFTGNSINFANTLIKAIKNQSFDDAIIELWPMLGANLATFRVPLRDKLGVGIATNVNFTDADVSETGGLQGDGVSKQLDLLVHPADVIGMGYWEQNFNATGTDSCIMGVTTGGTDIRWELDSRSTPLQVFFWGAPADSAGAAPANNNTHFFGQIVSGINRELYNSGLHVKTKVGGTFTPETSRTIKLMGGQLLTGTLTYRAGLCAVAYMTNRVLTADETLALHQTLDTYLIQVTGR